MFELRDYKMDDTLKTEGVWIDFGGGASFKIASLNNEDFVREFSRRTSAYTALGRDMPDDEMKALVIELMAAYIVLDWKGVYLDEKILKCTPDNASMVMVTFEPVCDRIIKEAKKLENFTSDEREKIEKN